MFREITFIWCTLQLELYLFDCLLLYPLFSISCFYNNNIWPEKCPQTNRHCALPLFEELQNNQSCIFVVLGEAVSCDSVGVWLCATEIMQSVTGGLIWILPSACLFIPLTFSQYLLASVCMWSEWIWWQVQYCNGFLLSWFTSNSGIHQYHRFTQHVKNLNTHTR